MNIEETKALEEFAVWGVMSADRRNALQKLLKEHAILVLELERVKKYVEVQDALLAEVREDLAHARRCLGGA